MTAPTPQTLDDLASYVKGHDVPGDAELYDGKGRGVQEFTCEDGAVELYTSYRPVPETLARLQAWAAGKRLPGSTEFYVVSPGDPTSVARFEFEDRDDEMGRCLYFHLQQEA